MKKNVYIQPVVEMMALEAAYTICAESKFSPLSPKGETETIDPATGGL